jgi:hypothetical protein
MNMRIALVVTVGLAAALQVLPAAAYENYIPLGTGYSSNVDALPDFDSEESRVIRKTDVYETELYMIGRKRVEDDSRLRRFFSESESNGPDNSIDY